MAVKKKKKMIFYSGRKLHELTVFYIDGDCKRYHNVLLKTEKPEGNIWRRSFR